MPIPHKKDHYYVVKVFDNMEDAANFALTVNADYIEDEEYNVLDVITGVDFLRLFLTKEKPN